jgi:NTE family protein
MLEDHGLVLGGGGVAGIAWMTGVLTGLADAGRAQGRTGLPDATA